MTTAAAPNKNKRKADQIEPCFTLDLATVQHRLDYRRHLLKLLEEITPLHINKTSLLETIFSYVLGYNPQTDSATEWCRNCGLRKFAYGGICYACGADHMKLTCQAVYREMCMDKEEFNLFKTTWPILRGTEFDTRLNGMIAICMSKNKFMTFEQIKQVLFYVEGIELKDSDLISREQKTVVPLAACNHDLAGQLIIFVLCFYALDLGDMNCYSHIRVKSNDHWDLDGVDGCAFFQISVGFEKFNREWRELKPTALAERMKIGVRTSTHLEHVLTWKLSPYTNSPYLNIL